jgi:predicted RND superfamily exporter protein
MGLNLHKINQRFAKVGERIVKMRWLNIFLFILIMLVSFAGLKKIKTDVSNDNWFLENDPALLAQEEFEDIFGNSDYTAVLVEADDIFQPEKLRKIRDLSDEMERYIPLSDEVLSLSHLEFSLGTEGGMQIIDLIPDKIPTDRAELENLRRLALSKPNIAGKLISKECDQTWIMLRLKTFPDNWETDKEYLQFIQRTAEKFPQFFEGFDTSKPQAPEILIGHVSQQIVDQEKYQILNPKTSGMPMVNYEKRIWFGKETPRLMGLALLLAVMVLIIFLRSLRGVVFPIISALSAIIIIFGIEGYMGIKIDPSMISLPMFLGFAVSVGYSIHVFTFYKRAVRDGISPQKASIFAVEETGWPILFTALTTIGALMSFLFIDVKSLRWIGLTSASLVFITYFLTLILLPSLLSFGKKKKAAKYTDKKKSPLLERSMGKLNDWIVKRPVPILIAFGIIIIICIWGLTKVEVSFDIKRSMGDKVPYAKRLLYVGDSKIGSLYSYDLGIEFPNQGDAKIPENLRKFEILENEVKSLKLTKKTSSLLDIVKDINQVLNEGKPEFYKIPSINDIAEYREMDLSKNKKNEIEKQIVAQIMLLYENAGGSEAERWMDYDEQRLHMMVELKDYNSTELEYELAYISKRTSELFPEARLIKAGTVVKYTAMQDIVAFGQINSFLIALGIIAILLIIVFGSIKTGLIGTIPNIAPALVVGGIMGFARIPLDMMTVTIMPMLLGLAVDDTIHFINHSHLEFNRTGRYYPGIRKTFIVTGSALFATSVVLILNFSAYLTSDAKVLSNLGLLACSGIAAALLADFFMIPILLKKGKVFGEEKSSEFSLQAEKTEEPELQLNNL